MSLNSWGSHRAPVPFNHVLVPFLVLQGTALVDPEGAKAVYAVSPCKDY